MTNNYCREKKCGREIPEGEKYCSFHQKKHKKRIGNILEAVAGLGFITLSFITKGKIDGGKS